MSIGGAYGAWLDAMHLDPDKTGVTLESLRRKAMMSLPEDLDYKIVRGFEGSHTIDVVVFSKKRFEETGCEYEAEVFRVRVTNKSGHTEIEVVEEQTTNIDLF